VLNNRRSPRRPSDYQQQYDVGDIRHTEQGRCTDLTLIVALDIFKASEAPVENERNLQIAIRRFQAQPF
jgi:hypothetical protein